MIRVTIEMVPHGVGTPRHLGLIEIANDGSGTTEFGNYKVRLAGLKGPVSTWKRDIIKSFNRKTRGPYDLLLQALISTVGDRNKSVFEEIKHYQPMMIEEDAQQSLF